MMSKTLRNLLVTVVLALSAATAAAREKTADARNGWSLGEEKRSVPQNVIRDADFPILAAVYAVVGLGGIAVLGFKPAKRTHLD